MISNVTCTGNAMWWRDDTSRIIGPSWGSLHGRPVMRSCDIICFNPGQSVEQTVELSVPWDAAKLMWHHYYILPTGVSYQISEIVIPTYVWRAEWWDPVGFGITVKYLI